MQGSETAEQVLLLSIMIIPILHRAARSPGARQHQAGSSAGKLLEKRVAGSREGDDKPAAG